MKIEKIKINNFRNIAGIEIEPCDDVNVIYGQNAQGKTNIIESIYLLSGVKSFRGATESQMIKFGEKSAVIECNFFAQEREQEIKLVLGENKKTLLNQIEQKSRYALADSFGAIIFSPSHLSLVQDGPRERRAFVDGGIAQLKSSYSLLLKQHKQALQQRNFLLKNYDKTTMASDKIEMWNYTLAKAGAKIIFQRQKYIERLEPYAEEIFMGISKGNESINIKTKSSFASEGTTPAQIEEELLEALKNNFSEDLAKGSTMLGASRDSIEILINGISARQFASQGQQRSAVIALKLSEAALFESMTGDSPVALLDDIMSELDERRQDYVLNHIKAKQAFITCCDKNTVLRLKKGKTFHIKAGGVV